MSSARERLQHEHAGAREQRAVDLEAGVLGGGADEGDGAVLGRRQEAVLLRLVEPVDLVDEEDGLRAAGLEPPARRVTISRMRGTPSVTALNGTNTRCEVLATRCASVVFPLPGGPQKIIEPGDPALDGLAQRLPGRQQMLLARRTRPASRGRMRAASGCASRAVDGEQRLLGARPGHASVAISEPIPPAAARPRRSQRPAEERRGGEPAALGLELGHQVRGRDVQRHARPRAPGRAGRAAPPARSAARPAPWRRPSTAAAPIARPRLCPPATITLAMVTPSGSLCSSTARNSRTPSRPETRNPLAIATPSKKVCSVSPSSAEMPAAAAQPVGLLAEVEVGGEHVLGQVHGEVPGQHVERRRSASRAAPRACTPSRATASMNPAPKARQASITRRLAALVAHHRERAHDVAERRGHREAERSHSSSRASASSVSRRVEAADRPAPGRAAPPAARRCAGPRRRAPGGRRRVTARSPRASGSPRSRISRTAAAHGGSPPVRQRMQSASRSSAARPTAASQRRTGARHRRPAGAAGPRAIAAARSISAFDARRRRSTAAGVVEQERP